MKFNLAKYIVPSVISMVLIGTYTNIDGFFIGNATGDNGLAAINFAWPIIAFATSIGTGIGVGGSVTVNTLRGKGLLDDVEKAKRMSLILLLFAGLITTALTLVLFSPILKLMGAEGQALEYAENYSLIVSAGAVFQVFGSGLVVLLRNEGKTFLSMLYTFIGLVVHVLLDMALVNKLALYGVATSTIASQAVVAVLCLISFRIKRQTGRGLTYIGQIAKSSVAPFGLNFVPSVVLLFTNFFAFRAAGAEAVSAYAVMSYAVYTFDYIYQGVCDGVQPVLSYCQGADDIVQKQRTVKTAVIILCVTSVIFIALTPALISLLPWLFNVSQQTAEFMRTGLIIYAFSYPFKAVVKYVCAYNYSIGKNIISNVITYIDPLLFSPLFLAVLPMAFGIDGIWIALPAAQIATSLASVILIAMYKRKLWKNCCSD